MAVMKKIYFDYAATTPLDKSARRAMEPYFSTVFGNPVSAHTHGKDAREAVERSRIEIATGIGVRAHEVIFTAGVTEANNMALFGSVPPPSYGKISRPPHVVVSAIEHSSILQAGRYLQEMGAHLTVVGVSRGGLVDPDEICRALTSETAVVSVMYVNNEVGTIQRIRALSEAISRWKRVIGRGKNDYPYFHTDAAQAPRVLPFHPHSLGADLLSIDGSKIYGPKGVGFLYVREGIVIRPLIVGAAQEGLRRAGTHNVTAIVGLAAALRRAEIFRKKEVKRLTLLKNVFLRDLMKRIPDTAVNGSVKESVPSIINFSIPGISGEALVAALNARGCEISRGSACLAPGDDTSYVVAALGGPSNLARESVRVSFGRETKKADVASLVGVIGEVTALFRKKRVFDSGKRKKRVIV